MPESQRPCLHPERELQAFMIKPIQRITKYGLLLDVRLLVPVGRVLTWF